MKLCESPGELWKHLISGKKMYNPHENITIMLRNNFVIQETKNGEWTPTTTPQHYKCWGLLNQK